MKRNKKRICQGAAIILIFFFITINAERIPVVGNLIAMRRIIGYVNTVYETPILDRYARYNPVSSCFYMEYKKGGETAIVSCDATGKIYDPKRTEELIEQIEGIALIAKQNEKDERQYGTITCYYEEKSYEPIITLGIRIREAKEPFPASQTDLIDKMWERFRLYYSLLSEKEKMVVDQIYISYQHYSEKKEDTQAYDEKIFSIRIADLRGQDMTKDVFYAATVAEEKIR